MHQNINKLKYDVDQTKLLKGGQLARRIRVPSDLRRLAGDEAGKSGECDMKKQDCRQRSCEFLLWNLRGGVVT